MSTETPLPPATAALPAAVAARLRAACPVHLPEDPTYDAARVAWNLAADQRPAAVAVPRTVEEVAAVVTAAATSGLRVAPQSTGHGAAALAAQDLDRVVLVRLGELTGVSVDPGRRTARVLGGTQWGEAVAAMAPHGLTALHGSAPDVGVVGYVLGGGLSFYGRQHGVAANTVRGIEVVLPDGTLVRADAERNTELYWALRGGGGSFGVVVAVELGLLSQPDVVAGMLLWDRELAEKVVRRWVEWSRTAPESVTTSLRVMSFPPLPELPPFLAGRDLVVIDGAVLADDATADSVLAPLRELEPEMDTFARVPAPVVLGIHMDPPGPTPAVGDHACLGALDDAAVAAFLAQVGPGTSTGLLFTELRHLGGALGRPATGGGVVSRLPGEYALHTVAVAPTPEAALAGRAAGFAVLRALEPWAVDGLVPTFADGVTEANRLHGSGDLERLRRLRDRIDPDRVMVAAHRL
ncbi:FAD-binding protein [Nocardioides sambongensis]|uniref:FAD-binding protein n=1 Tax=Nocardioides sambongensis TaxID=2589074 RepID=UPI001127C10B|nr:FAD-binding protein [Nocardioides sambongensis]